MHIFKKLWQDQGGEASSMALILLTTIVALGAIAGLISLRNQIVQELGDIGLALENIDQSYSTNIGSYMDMPPSPATDPIGQPPGDLDFVSGS